MTRIANLFLSFTLLLISAAATAQPLVPRALNSGGISRALFPPSCVAPQSRPYGCSFLAPCLVENNLALFSPYLMREALGRHTQPYATAEPVSRTPPGQSAIAINFKRNQIKNMSFLFKNILFLEKSFKFEYISLDKECFFNCY